MVGTTAGVHLALLAVSAVATAGLGAYAWPRRAEPGVRPFVALMAALTVWTGCYAVALLQPDRGARLFWERLQWFGIPFVGVTMFWFGVAYTGRDEWLSRRRLALLAVPAVLTVPLVWTNHLHGLIWTETELVKTGVLTLAAQDFGLWYWLHLGYAYLLIALASLLLLRLLVVSDYLYLDQSALLLVGIAVPLVGNAVSVAGVAPLPGIDLTPYALSVTGITFGHALFRYRLFEMVPATRHIGRNVAIADLEDGVVIVDEDDRIVYCNEAAGDILEEAPGTVLGESLLSYLPADAIEFDTEDALAEVSLADRTYEVRSSTVTDPHDRGIGHTLVITDITERKRREQTLRRQRDRLKTLDHINRVIRGVNQALVGATTREEIQETVPEKLVESDLYETACLGTGVSSVDDLTCRVSDGGEIAASTDGGEDVLLDAIHSAEGLAEPGNSPEALELPARLTGGPESGVWTTVPLVHERTVYGVLVVFTTRPDAFSERELAVLDELGETIGHAINAVENRHLLLSDAVVEIELESTDAGSALVSVSDDLDCRFELEGVVPVEDRHLLAYVTVEDADPSRVRTTLAESGVAEVRQVDDGERVLELTLSEASLLVPLVAYGVNVRSAVVSDGTCELVAELSPDTEPRAVMERVQEPYPDTRLVAKREREPARETDELAGALSELTDRQSEVLEAAYRAGYFDWPRENTAEEVADSLEISSPTLHNHLRKAQRKVLREVLDS
jgi:predicted DNA binding protein